MYLESIVLSAEVSLTLKGQARLLSLGLGCLEDELPRFMATILHVDVGNNLLSYLGECLCQISYQRIVERSCRDPLFERGDHENFIMGLESYCKCPESVQLILQQLSLPLFHVEEVIQHWRLDLVDRELFSKQSGELLKRGDVAIGKPAEPL